MGLGLDNIAKNLILFGILLCKLSSIIMFLDIAFKDAIKDVTNSESNYCNFAKTLHLLPLIPELA